MSSVKEVMTLDQLRQRIHDWRLPMSNWVFFQLEDHRGGLLAEVEFEHNGDICTDVRAIRRLTKD